MHIACAIFIVALLLLSCSYLSNALQCYRCDTTKNKEDKNYNAPCIKPTKDQASTTEEYLSLQTCSSEAGKKTFCFKNTDEKLSAGYYIQRGCFYSKDYKEPTCVDGEPKEHPDLRGKTCLCDKDLCNGEGSGGIPSVLLLSPPLWFLVQFPLALRLLGLISIC